MIGYMIEQELGNLLPFEVPFATILTMVEVDRDDPGFKDPTKFVGPVYSEAEAKSLAAEKGWTMKMDGDKWRRVVLDEMPLPSACRRGVGYRHCCQPELRRKTTTISLLLLSAE